MKFTEFEIGEMRVMKTEDGEIMLETGLGSADAYAQVYMDCSDAYLLGHALIKASEAQ